MLLATYFLDKSHLAPLIPSIQADFTKLAEAPLHSSQLICAYLIRSLQCLAASSKVAEKLQQQQRKCLKSADIKQMEELIIMAKTGQ